MVFNPGTSPTDEDGHLLEMEEGQDSESRRIGLSRRNSFAGMTTCMAFHRLSPVRSHSMVAEHQISEYFARWDFDTQIRYLTRSMDHFEKLSTNP